MKIFTYNEATSFSYSKKISYSINGQIIDDENSRDVLVKRETEKTPFGLKTRLCIENLNVKDIFLINAYPLYITECTFFECAEVLNQGRHKNDLPSLCLSTLRDDSFSDAVNRLSEEGKLVVSNQDSETELYGDQITVLHQPTTDAYLAISFATADIQLTEIIIKIDENKKIQSICAGGEFNCLLKSKEKIYTDWVEVDCQGDIFKSIDKYARKVADSKGVRPSENKPAVYSTWYYYGKEVKEKDVYVNLDGIKNKGLPFTHFQIDAGWEKNYGDWEANEKFSSGMKKIADDIKNYGLKPGIWTCPLIANQNAPVCHEHPDWILRHTDGNPCIFSMLNIEYFVFDCTNPEVIAWIEKLYQKLVSWGYQYHKLDFTRAFPIQKDVIYHNPYITPVQAYVNAMKAVKRGIGDNGYLLICGGLYQPLVGIADAERTGSDVRSTWLDDNGMPKIPFTVKQNVLRYYMNEWWHNDPDSLMVRYDTEGYKVKRLSIGTLTDDEAIIFAANQYFGGGLIGSTEATDKISDDRLYLLKHIMPVIPTKIKGFDTNERFPSMIDVYVEKGWHTLCFVNWTDEKKDIKFVLDESLVDAGKEYYVSSFFGSKIIKNAHFGDYVAFGELQPHSAQIIKIAPNDIPQVVKSDCHFSMGGEIDLEYEKNTLTFSTYNPYPIDMHYTVCTPDSNEYLITVEGNKKYTQEVIK